jgi:FdhD protein
MPRHEGDPSEDFSALAWRNGDPAVHSRQLPTEVAVALIHDATTTAVLMATPTALADLGVGFSLTEGIVQAADGIRSLDVIETDLGFEVRMWLSPACGAALVGRRRLMAGPTGCGLCGIESLEQAVRPPANVSAELTLSSRQIQTALAELHDHQSLNAVTRAVHAAGYWTPDEGLLAVREDVGRHNALDKLVGALAPSAAPVGAVLLTSRVSVEMVQKAARLGAPIIIAVSAPTTLAVRQADSAGITLAAIARDDGFEIFTHPRRITGG